MAGKSVSFLCSPPNIIPDLDAGLIQATLNGNQESFSELMRKHHPTVFLMVHRHLRQREEAEDVVQQIFLKAFQHLVDFRGESKFSTWLYTISLNLIRNHVRQRALRRMDSLDVPAKTEDGPSPQWPDKAPLPEDIIHYRWEMDRVRIALLKLPQDYRAIFTLHYFQHLSLNEVAERVGRPEGTVKVYLHRARKMILSDMQSQEKTS
jgi:RNA polymerase sigma-70 factor, ECF subfamily